MPNPRPAPALAPLHLRPAALAAVAVGGLLGAPARYGLSRLLPTPAHGWPVATFLTNVAGAFLLGVLLEALARSGPDTDWRQQLRLLAGTGFCGALTTYSALAVETDLLAGQAPPALAVGYPVISVLAGLLATAAGIALAARFPGRPPMVAALPVDPDLSGPTGGPSSPPPLSGGRR